MSHFYSHLVKIETITIELDEMDFSEEEKDNLAKLIDANLHHSILDVILSELEFEDKSIFLDHLSNNDHQTIWNFLNSKIESVDEKIVIVANDVIEELKFDIMEAKKIL